MAGVGLRELEQLADDVRSLDHALVDVTDIELGALVEGWFEQLGEAHDRGQLVVQLVSDSADESIEEQLLFLAPQMPLHGPLIADVLKAGANLAGFADPAS